MAPSRDIALCFANMDRVKHTVTGGWWKDFRTGKWTHASVSILRHLLQDHPEHAKLIGLCSKEARTPGKWRIFFSLFAMCSFRPITAIVQVV